MPLLIAPLLGLLLGLVFARAARDELAFSERGPLSSPSIIVVAAYGLLVHAPITGYFLTYAPDWSYAYLVDSQKLPAAMEIAGTLVAAGSPLLAFAVAAPSTVRRRSPVLFRAAVVLVVMIIVLSAVLGPRWATEATYTQYYGDFGTRSVAGSDLGYALLWMNGVIVLAVLWVVQCLRAMSRRAQRH